MRAARDLMGLDGTLAVGFMARSGCCLDMAGVELGGRGDSVVGGGDDVVGEVDQSSPGWLWQRDQLIGGDLAAGGPGYAFVAGLALLDRDLGFALGSHADEALER
jgi:hypothetical protein